MDLSNACGGWLAPSFLARARPPPLAALGPDAAWSAVYVAALYVGSWSCPIAAKMPSMHPIRTCMPTCDLATVQCWISGTHVRVQHAHDCAAAVP